MEKPKKQVIEIYDFGDCMDYLEEKYNFDHRDYKGSFSSWNRTLDQAIKQLGFDKDPDFDIKSDLGGADKNDPKIAAILEKRGKVYELQDTLRPEYCNFWHWITDNQEVHNGCNIYFFNEFLDNDLKDWQRTILTYILDEFGEGEEQECTFRVEW